MISSCVSSWFRIQMKTADLKCPHADDLKEESYHQLGRKKRERKLHGRPNLKFRFISNFQVMYLKILSELKSSDIQLKS